MKKIFALILALVMVFSLTTVAFAAEQNENAPVANGSITINNTVVGETYNVYRVFDLVSYDTEAGAYSYKLSTKWAGFTAPGFFSVNYDGYVVADAAFTTEEKAIEFAALALAYAVENSIEADQTAKAEAATVKFTELPLGYYLIDSSLGLFCILDTTNPSFEMAEKNDQPANLKLVEEDSNGKFVAANDADMTHQVINFKSTITVEKGAVNYVFHDVMSAGFTYDATSLKVQVNGADVAAANYTVASAPTDGCTLEIAFEDEYILSLAADTEIVITYSAKLTGATYEETHTNKSWVTYGDGQTTPPSETITKTFDFNVFKHDENGAALADAIFNLTKTVEETTYYAVVGTDGILDSWTTVAAEATALKSDAEGKFSVKGLDADTYALVEIEAPEGYNKLKDPIAFSIDAEGNVMMDGEAQAEETIKVQNNTGAELPSTGGIGTTIFYVLGAIMMLGAAVLLITKRRMSVR